MQTLSGNWASLLLPINADDSIDFARLADAIDVLIAAGVDGIYSNGTACEFYAQTETEFDAIQALLAQKCSAAGMAFMVGANEVNPTVQLQRLRRARQWQPRAIQVILPEWWPASNAEARAFLLEASDIAAGTDLVLYNPPHAKRVLAPVDLAAVTIGTDVVACKLGLPGSNFYAEARQQLRHLAVFVPGHHLASGVREGVAAGSFSNVACLSPSGAQRWTALMQTDLDTALQWQARIQAFMTGHILPYAERGYSNAALDKLLAAIGGWADVGTRLRSPYRSIDPADALALRAIAHDAMPEIMRP
jgi:dihydrodipicolinate synthase/N-acetylneuraminate lyase